jgi:hypothetical protein
LLNLWDRDRVLTTLTALRTNLTKNYRHSVNIQVIATLDRRIVYLSPAWPDNRNGIVVAKATITLPAGRHHHPHRRWLALPARSHTATQT